MGKPDRIKISKEFNVMGSGEWLTIEMPISENEDPIEEFKKGKSMLMDAFRATNPGVQSFEIPEPAKQVEKTPTGDVLHDISTCKEINVLKTYQLLVRGNKSWQEAYDRQMIELKTPKKKNGKIVMP